MGSVAEPLCQQPPTPCTAHLEHVDLGELLLRQQQRRVVGKVLRNLEVLWADELQRLRVEGGGKMCQGGAWQWA